MKYLSLEEFRNRLRSSGVIDKEIDGMLSDLRDPEKAWAWLVRRREGYCDVVIDIDYIDFLTEQLSEDLTEDLIEELGEEKYYEILSERGYIVEELLSEKLRERGLKVMYGREVGEVIVIPIESLPTDIWEIVVKICEEG